MYEIVEFRKSTSTGKIVGKRLSRRDGPIIFPSFGWDAPLYSPRIVRLRQLDGKNVCIAHDVQHFEPYETTTEWQTATAKGQVLLAGSQGNIVVLSPSGSIRWPNPPQGLGPYPLAIDWLDEDRSLGVAVMLGDPMGELRPLYLRALHAHCDIHRLIDNEVDRFVRERKEEAEKAGQITYTHVETYADWHPYREDYEPWAPPLPPNATKHSHKVIDQGQDVIDRIKADAEEFKASLYAEHASELDRTEAEMKSIKRKLEDFCSKYGLSVPGLP